VDKETPPVRGRSKALPIGSRLRMMRKALTLTQADMGIDQSQLSVLENCDSDMALMSKPLRRYIEALGIKAHIVLELP